MFELLIAVVPALVTALITYFTMRSKNENDLKLAKTKYESEVKQIKMQHDHELDMKKHEHEREIETRRQESQREIEKIEKEYKLKSKSKEEDIVLEKTSDIFGKLFNADNIPGLSESFQEDLEKKMQQEMMKNHAQSKKK